MNNLLILLIDDFFVKYLQNPLWGVRGALSMVSPFLESVFEHLGDNLQEFFLNFRMS